MLVKHQDFASVSSLLHNSTSVSKAIYLTPFHSTKITSTLSKGFIFLHITICVVTYVWTWEYSRSTSRIILKQLMIILFSFYLFKNDAFDALS